MKIKNKTKKLTLKILSLALSTAIVASSGAFTAFAETAKPGLDAPVGGNYFISDYQSRSELSAEAYKVRAQIWEEGHVLLKNEDNALPLAEGTKISVFGKNYSSSGFSKDEFTNAGFKINDELIKFYSDSSRSGAGRASIGHANITLSGLPTGETPVANYDAKVEASYAEYNDAALVYFYRSVGEGRDSPLHMTWDGSGYEWKEGSTQLIPGARAEDDHYLQLDENEAALLKYVGDKFDKVIVVLACGSQMETGFLDDPNHYAYHENIKAAIWSGSSKLAHVLKGDVSPSGKTTDTWYRDFKLDPTWQNIGNNAELDGNEYSNLASSSNYINRYVMYQEGIYMGYRYYETRGYLEGSKAYTSPSSGDRAFHGTSTTQWDNWYDAHVVTPFGYGLSYTTFDWQVVNKAPAEGSALSADGTITVDVKVTNTGNYPGKDVVQLYYTAPYTTGEIEKAHVVLGAYEKTQLLQPGESDTVTLTMKVRDMASYDWNDANKNDFKGYELDDGEYVIRLMRNSHEEVQAINYSIEENIKYSTSAQTGKEIKNRFDDVSNYLINDVKKQYMSRADFEGTFPTKSIKIQASQWVIDGIKEWEVSGGVSQRPADADKNQPYYTEEMPTTGAKNGLVLADMYHKDYDDPAWDSFLDQLTYQNLVDLATRGSYYSGINIPELGITKEINTDGIGGLNAYAQHKELIGSVNNTSWGAQTRLAATWNKELAYKKGRIIGNEGLWGGSVEYTRIPGYYAPGVNIHRTPFGGRNSQYFSEDGYLTGSMASQIVKGAMDKGMFTYVKHFAINEQETNRIGVMTWANEQSMREIYLKGFELCVTEGGATGIMSALNRVGYTWTGGSYALLTEVLRHEWGFNGCVVTDSYMGDNSNLSNADQMIRAGGNLALGNASLKYNTNTPTTVSVLREMAHGLLYMHANSMVLNSAERPVVPPKLSQYIGDVLPNGAYMFPYSASVATAQIGERYPEYTDSDVKYTLAEGSNPLPAGLTLAEDGTISGTPTAMVSNHKITVKATCVDYSLTATFTINVTSGAPEIVYTTNDATLASAKMNENYSVSVATAEYFAPGASQDVIDALPQITYTLKNGSTLPAGLRLTASGKILGCPTEQCIDYKFSVLAIADGKESKEVEYSISVLADLTFGSKELKLGRYGENYLDRVQLAECDNAVSYLLKEGSTLPNGLTLTSSGYITGKPTQTVTDHEFTVQAVSKYSETQEVVYKISIGIKFGDKTTLPDAEVGENYSTRIDTAQGVDGVKYKVKEGSVLPNGLTLSQNGKITGKPTEAGVYEITFVAEADDKVSDEITLVLYVATAKGSGVSIALEICGGAMIAGGAGLIVFFLIKNLKKPTGSNDPEKPKKKAKTNSKDEVIIKVDEDNNGEGAANGSAQAKKEKPKKEKSEKPKDNTSKIKRDPYNKKPFFVCSIVFSSLFIFCLIVSLVLTQNQFLFYTICSVFGGSERYLKEGSPQDYQYYTADYQSKEDALNAANALNEQIVEEGIILLKNNDQALPLATATNITVFGKNSVNLVLGGSGSNAGSSASVEVDVYASLENAGFTCNPTLKNFYKDNSKSGNGRPEVPAMGDVITGFPTAETPLSAYTQSVKNSYAQYNDAAVVILSRIGGEGYDLPRSMFWDGSTYQNWSSNQTIPGAKSKDSHYLELDKNEEDLLKEACANFDKVIVVFNSASTIELGFLNDPTFANVKGALWMGNPGVSGIEALGKVLKGTVTPSGKTIDTFAKDFTQDPTWYNFGNNLSDGGNSYMRGGKAVNAYFVEYREGIYTGYRYYETRGFTEGNTWYENNVMYPFGYGLSYTQFDYTVTPSSQNEATLTKDGKLSFDVEVENVGTQYDGKEVVQLYYSAEYKDTIEKSHVVLGDFAKTSLLAKNGGKDTVTLDLDVKDMASYDYNDANGNGFKGYELEEGTYTIYITIGSNGAHCWADTNVAKYTFTVGAGGIKYDADTDAKNLFDDVSNGIAQENYLSRKNNFANFDNIKGGFSTANRTKDTAFISSLTYKINDKTTDPWYATQMPKQSGRELSYQETETKLFHLIGKDFNDPLWDELLNQLTVDQMVRLVSTGNYRTLEIENIDKPLTTDPDGPMGYAVFMGDPSVYGTCFYASECVLGATWNVDLAYAMGKMVGNEGVIGNKRGDGRPYAGWYAPAVNLHRSQFGGRNFEYYSEDGYISGMMAQNVIKGAMSKGVYTYLKHFALNEQETNRDTTGLITWANEQAMRENYFVPFEICVKEGGTTAMMSSFNRLGTTWSGGSYNLLTKLLREEWGFNGMVITDFNLKPYMNTDQMIRAGGDINLSANKAPTSQTTATDVASIRRSAKNVLYTVANSCAMNGYGAGVVWGYSIPWWVIWLMVADCVSFAAGAGMFAVFMVKKLKEKKSIDCEVQQDEA